MTIFLSPCYAFPFRHAFPCAQARIMVYKDTILNMLYHDEPVMDPQGQWTVADFRATMTSDVAAICHQNLMPWQPLELLDLKVLGNVSVGW